MRGVQGGMSGVQGGMRRVQGGMRGVQGGMRGVEGRDEGGKRDGVREEKCFRGCKRGTQIQNMMSRLDEERGLGP